MEVNEILEKMRKEDRLLLESAVMLSVQKALIDMGYEPFEDKVRGVYTAIENTPIANGWIPCSERLPEDGQQVLVYYNNCLYSCMSVAKFRKGKTKEELQAMERPCFGSADQWGNNLKPYAWFGDGPTEWFGQEIIAWQPLPEPYQEPAAVQKNT